MPQPTNTLPGLGGRKTLQDAWYTIDLGQQPLGQLVSAQYPDGHPDSWERGRHGRPHLGQGKP